MKNTEALEVSKYLTSLNISHELSKAGTDDVLLVNRDSIVKWGGGREENAAYETLTIVLKASFKARFLYVAKSDEWLMLDKIGE